MMRLPVPFGQQTFDLDVPDDRLVRAKQEPAANVPDPLTALAHALEHPYNFPPLRQALTPDDHITIVVDAALPGVGHLLGPILEHITAAGVEQQAITVLCPAGPADPAWRQDLPALFRRVTVQVHDPVSTKGLCYLATTKEGQRLYLNRTLVESDQLVVLSGRRYDPLLGYAGAESALYPAFGDEEAQRQTVKVRPLPPAEDPVPAVKVAREVAWLLGAPFFVQVIEGSGDGVASIVTGTHEASAEGRHQQDARWKQPIPRLADLVVATLPGDPTRHTFADLATAVSRAARVVSAHGAIALLAETSPDLGPAGEFLRDCEDAEDAVRQLGRHPSPELLPAWNWVGAASQARIYIHGMADEETVERLFATSLDDLGQIQRLADRAANVLVLPDAHKALPVLEE
jgi:nickel-dependent lactate racemase